MTAFKLITPPAVEPVTLDEAKTHARIDTTADDALVANLIAGARQWAEHYTGRAFIAQTWQLWLDRCPGADKDAWDGMREGPIGFDETSYVILPRPPLVSVSSVQHFDNGDNAAVWSASNYFVDTIGEPGRLALRMGAVWPAPGRLINGIGIEYIAGYGSDAGAVPETIRAAIRQLVAHWYEHRGETAPGTGAPVPLVIQALLDPYRVRRFSI